MSGLAPLMYALKQELETIRNQAAWIGRKFQTPIQKSSCSRTSLPVSVVIPFTSLAIRGTRFSGARLRGSKGLRNSSRNCSIRPLQGSAGVRSSIATPSMRCLPKEFAEIAKHVDYSKGRNATAADDFPAFRERLDNQRALVAVRGLLGMPTGLPKLDEALCGVRAITFCTQRAPAKRPSCCRPRWQRFGAAMMWPS